MSRLLAMFAAVGFLAAIATPASAAVNCTTSPLLCRCVAIVFYDPTMAVPDDLYFVLRPWSAVKAFNSDIVIGDEVAGVHVYYDQFGNQGGPTAEDISTDGDWTSWVSLQYVAPTVDEPREELIVGKFDNDASAAQYQGSKSIYKAALDDTENVGTTFPPNSFGAQADNVRDGNELSELKSVSVPFTVGVRSVTLAGAAILDEILANGCP